MWYEKSDDNLSLTLVVQTPNSVKKLYTSTVAAGTKHTKFQVIFMIKY